MLMHDLSVKVKEHMLEMLSLAKNVTANLMSTVIKIENKLPPNESEI